MPSTARTYEVVEAVGRLLDARHDAAREGRALDELSLHAPREQAARVGEQVTDRAQRERLVLEPQAVGAKIIWAQRRQPSGAHVRRHVVPDPLRRHECVLLTAGGWHVDREPLSGGI